MFYGLLLENSAWGELSNEPVNSNAKDDESWLLGLEAWVPCFILLGTCNEANCGNKASAVCFGAGAEKKSA